MTRSASRHNCHGCHGLREHGQRVLIGREHFFYSGSLDAEETQDGGKECLSVISNLQGK